MRNYTPVVRQRESRWLPRRMRCQQPDPVPQSWATVAYTRTDEDLLPPLESSTHEMTITIAVGSRSLRHQDGLGLPTRRMLARRMMLDTRALYNANFSALESYFDVATSSWARQPRIASRDGGTFGVTSGHPGSLCLTPRAQRFHGPVTRLTDVLPSFQ